MMHPWLLRARLFLGSLEQHLATMNRQKVIFIFFGAFAVLIIGSAFRISILNHQKYADLADKQQTTEIKNGVSR